MNYYVVEGILKEDKKAHSKARLDCSSILNELNFTPLSVRSKDGVQKEIWKKPLQYFIYKNNLSTWLDSLVDLEVGDTLVIQYPLLNTTSHFDRYLVDAKKKGVKTVALIHDLNSLRFTAENCSPQAVKRIRKEDRTLLSLFSSVISHNPVMSSYLKSINCQNVVNLYAFDYLTDYSGRGQTVNADEAVVIAGNLNPVKAGYLSRLGDIQCHFNLYGVEAPATLPGNTTYKGSFLPEELPGKLEGKFGLIWDGDSIDGCVGGYGQYLSYNNPHKLSLFLAAGLPVITWDKAAIAEFITKNNIGFTVPSLQDLPQAISCVNDELYKQYLNNISSLQKKVLQGSFLKNAIAQIDTV